MYSSKTAWWDPDYIHNLMAEREEFSLVVIYSWNRFSRGLCPLINIYKGIYFALIDKRQEFESLRIAMQAVILLYLYFMGKMLVLMGGES